MAAITVPKFKNNRDVSPLLLENGGIAYWDPTSKTIIIGVVSFTDITNTPTTLSGYGITDSYTQEQTDNVLNTRLNDLLNNAPAALDTLGEIAAQLSNDEDAVTSLTNVVAGKEPSIAAGTTGQYWRGDKSWQTLNAAAVGALDQTGGDARYLQLTGGTLSGQLNIQGATHTGTILLGDDVTAQGRLFYDWWNNVLNIDNLYPNGLIHFRFGTSTKMSMNAQGDFVFLGNINLSEQQKFSHLGSATNDSTQAATLYKPSSAPSANYQAIRVEPYNSTTPVFSVDNIGTVSAYVINFMNSAGVYSGQVRANYQNNGAMEFSDGFAQTPLSLSQSNVGTEGSLNISVQGMQYRSNGGTYTDHPGLFIGNKYGWNGKPAFEIGSGINPDSTVLSIDGAGVLETAGRISTASDMVADGGYKVGELEVVDSEGNWVGVTPYDISGGVSGIPTSSMMVSQFISLRGFFIPEDFGSSIAVVNTEATGTTVFSIQKNGVEFGTLTFSSGSSEGVFSTVAQTAFSTGDILTIVSPETPDDTLSDMTFMINGVLI